MIQDGAAHIPSIEDGSILAAHCFSVAPALPVAAERDRRPACLPDGFHHEFAPRAPTGG